MGNAAGSPIPVSVPSVSNQMNHQKSSSECPNKNSTITDSPSKLLPAPSQAPKCPISGQESKEGKTCAYDPTKMSFWQTKALSQMVQKPFETNVTPTEVSVIETGGCPVKKSNVAINKEEGCPMKVKANSTESKEEKSASAFVKVYKNPTQYNVSCLC